MQNAEYWIQNLNLIPHPEGGFFREIYRSNLEIDQKFLPYGIKGSRRLCTSIYYLLRSKDISKLHRLKSDELWYYHYGSTLKIVMIDQEGNKHTKFLGANAEKSEHLQIEIPAGTIFGALITEEESYCLVSCVVSPGFDFNDFEIFDREDLIQAYPKHIDVINRLT
jgi:uncharacterized protein